VGIHRYNPWYLPRPCPVTNWSTESTHVRRASQYQNKS